MRFMSPIAKQPILAMAVVVVDVHQLNRQQFIELERRRVRISLE